MGMKLKLLVFRLCSMMRLVCGLVLVLILWVFSMVGFLVVGE